MGKVVEICYLWCLDYKMQVSQFCGKGCTARSKPLLTSGQLNRESLLVQFGAPLLPEPAEKGGEGTGREQDCQYLLLGGCQDEGALISVEGSAVPNRSSHLSGKHCAACRQSQEQRLRGVLGCVFLLGKWGCELHGTVLGSSKSIYIRMCRLLFYFRLLFCPSLIFPEILQLFCTVCAWDSLPGYPQTEKVVMECLEGDVHGSSSLHSRVTEEIDPWVLVV